MPIENNIEIKDNVAFKNFFLYSCYSLAVIKKKNCARKSVGGRGVLIVSQLYEA